LAGKQKNLNEEDLQMADEALSHRSFVLFASELYIS